MKFCVVIPARNEARAIGSLVVALRQKQLDVFVIDDASADATASIAQNAGAHVLINPERRGKGGSLKRGFEHVKSLPYDGVFAIDGDGQHDPDDLPAFITFAQAHPRCVISGNRMGNCKNMPFVRVCTNRFMSWMISSACGRTIPDTQCGYRYLSMSVLKEIPLVSDDFEIETEMLVKACRAGIPVFSVPIRTIYGEETSKIHPWKDTVRFFKYFFQVILTR